MSFVPVKLNNQRLPNKNTKNFDDGTALISYFLDTLTKVKGIDELYVYCSDEKISDYLIPGVKLLRREKTLDTQETTPQDIISAFMEKVYSDIYMVAHCTSPFVTTDHFEECIQAVKSGDFDSSFTGKKIQSFLWNTNNIPLNFEADNIPRTQDLLPIYSEVSAAYVFHRSVFENYRRRIGIQPHITEVSGIECVDIDYPEDFEIANAIYMNIIKKEWVTK